MKRRTQFSKYLTAAVLAFGLGAATAQVSQAAPVTWQLDFQIPGGSASGGTFVFDADTSAFSNINVLSFGGGLLPGNRTYIATHPDASGTRASFLTTAATDPTGSFRLDIGLVAAMTNAGGSIGAAFGSEHLCLDAGCGFSGFSQDVASGISVAGFSLRSVPISAVPLPAASLLLLTGIAGLGVFGRRKKWKARA